MFASATPNGRDLGSEGLRDEVLAAFRRCLPTECKLLVIHSSLPSLRPPNGVKWAVLAALRALADSGITVAVPAFTFGFCQGAPFHHKSPSETGVLADWMLTLVGARRTHHPIYSFAAVGPLTTRLLECVNTTTFGADSSFAFFEDIDASIMMLGSDWKYCTQFHRYEEEAKVPYRTHKDFNGLADFGNGEQPVSVGMFVRDLEVNAENDWSRLESALRAQSAVRSIPLWRGIIEVAACHQIARIARQQLAADPFAMVHNATSVEYACSQAKSRASSPALKIALLGSSNLEILKGHLASAAKNLVRDQSVEIYTAPYGQLFLEIENPESGLYQFGADYAFFCDRLEDLTGAASMDLLKREVVSDRVSQYASAIAEFRSKFRGWVFINRFAASSGGLSGESHAEMEAIPTAANMVLTESLDGANNLHFFDISRAGVSSRAPALHDPRLWFLGRFPFSDDASRHLAKYYCGLILAATGRTARLIALDLDNTLWGGVLGEDGLAGLAVGGDYPGNAFVAFQRGLKLLTERGIALALLSKNDEDLALKALTELPGMVLQKQDFVARRINWEPKWRNIVEICDELSLGLENVLFVDDNPVETDQMRLNQPAVKVHDLPEDPSLYLQSLVDSPWLASLTITAEDRKRVAGFRQRSSLLEDKARCGANVEDFYVSLGSVVYMQQYDQGNSARAVQLLQKTNQFNTTTRRYGVADIERVLTAGDDVFVIGLHDRYSEFENIGLAILRWNQPQHGWALIDSYLLSCRVLGRGIETAILQSLLSVARKKGMHAVAGEIVETSRNTPVRTVFADAGFSSDKTRAGLWVFDLQQKMEVFPPWLSIVNGGPSARDGGRDAI